MKAALVIALAATSAHADKLVVDKSGLEVLLKDEKLMKRFGTVGYPLADEVKADGNTCVSGATFDLGFADYKQTVNDARFVARLIAPIELQASPYSMGTRILAWPTLELFGDAYTPVGALIDTYHHSDGTSSIDAQIHVLSFVVSTESTRIPSAASYAYAFGYQLPPDARQLGPDDLGVALAPYQRFAGSFSMSGHAAGIVTVQAAPDGIQARVLLAAEPEAHVGAELGTCNNAGTYCQWAPLPYDLQLGTYQYGARVQLLPRSDGTWVSDVSASASWAGVMGMTIDLVDGLKRLLWPMNHVKDLAYGCKLEPKFTPKPKP